MVDDCPIYRLLLKFRVSNNVPSALAELFFSSLSVAQVSSSTHGEWACVCVFPDLNTSFLCLYFKMRTHILVS